MSTPRDEQRQRHARTFGGRDPAHGDAVVRQRLRAVTTRSRDDAPVAARPARSGVVPGDVERRPREEATVVTRGGRPALAWHPVTGPLPQLVRDGERDGSDLGPHTDAPPGLAALGVEPPGWLPTRPLVDETSSGPLPEPGADPPADPREPPAPAADQGTDDELSPGDLARRMRQRAATTVASAYTAAHGHPTAHSGFGALDEDDDVRRRRWRASPRVAVTALVVVLVLAAGVATTSLRSSGGVEPLATVGAQGGSLEGPADDAASEPTAPDEDGTEPPDPGVTGAEATAGDPVGTGVVVHVVGQVTAPGLVTVAADARVADALEAAGGATSDADLAALNLARTVADGEQIVVPRPGDAVPAPVASPGGGATGADGVVDLNAADAATLDALPGIGPVLAERIVAWRDENGPFTAVDELGEVSGIGPAVLADVRDLVRV